MNVWVLTKETVARPGEEPGVARPFFVCLTEEVLLEKVERIAQANRQYPMEKIGFLAWRIGPTEDEGFFGNRAYVLRGYSMPVREAAAFR